MKKIVLLCLTIILISYNYLFGFSAGFMGSGAAKNAGGAPAVGQDFTEEFDFDTSGASIAGDENWNLLEDGTATMAVDGDAAYIAGSDTYENYTAIYDVTAVDTVNQYVLIEIKDIDIRQGAIGAIFRSASSDGTGNYYFAKITAPDTNNWEFKVEKLTGMSHIADIGTANAVDDNIEDGTWIGFAISGTGDSTTFTYWDFGVSDPGAWGTWGAASSTEAGCSSDCTFNTGNYIGLGIYWVNTGSDHLIDTWRGGDQ